MADLAGSVKQLEKKIAELNKDLASLDKRVTTMEGSLKDAWSNIVNKSIFDRVSGKVTDLEKNQSDIWKKLGM
jgi:hypothetical protein